MHRSNVSDLTAFGMVPIHRIQFWALLINSFPVFSKAIESMWAGVINPLLLGWGNEPDQNQNSRVIGFALFWLMVI